MSERDYDTIALRYSEVAKEAMKEALSAASKWAALNSAHEGYAVLLEEPSRLPRWRSGSWWMYATDSKEAV